MPILSERDRMELQRQLAGLVHPVRLVLFAQTINCPTCPEARRLLEELAGLSDKISLEVHNPVTEREVAQHYGVTRVPTIAVLRDGDPPRDYGVRFLGAPGGYEFATLVQTVLDVSRETVDLQPETLSWLQTVKEPLHFQVFVTPT
ncbi:MAG TPA: hypothetical protein VIN09_08475 [Chloroflexota bacterium]